MRQTLSICDIDENDPELKRYNAISDGILTSSELLRIEEIIKSVHVSSGLDPKFIFLEGSSGTGKTQTALAIRRKFSPQKVLYLLARTLGDRDQQIYHVFGDYPRRFVVVLNPTLLLLLGPSQKILELRMISTLI